MLHVFLALLVVVALMLAYAGGVRLLLNPDSALWAAVRRRRQARAARREVADLDREYASLLDEYRHIP